MTSQGDVNELGSPVIPGMYSGELFQIFLQRFRILYPFHCRLSVLLPSVYQMS